MNLLLRFILFFLAILWLPSTGLAQTTLIPDVNFENKLIDDGYDTNGQNGNILNSDAEVVTNLLIQDFNISDLTGIEAFTNLIVLRCSANQLTSLDLSTNTALRTLDCSNNQLTSLDLRNIFLYNIFPFNATNNPNLSCILVDDPNDVPTGISENVDMSIYFSTTCSTPVEEIGLVVSQVNSVEYFCVLLA
jgi:hypothetical protein